MPERKPQRPTAGELEILRVLWERGPGSVRDVHEALAAARRNARRAAKPTSYNTTLKLMQIMHGKGILTRDDSRRPQVYTPAVPEEQMQSQLAADFLERVFGGSARKLMAALTSADIPKDELARIRQLLDELEEG